MRNIYIIFSLLIFSTSLNATKVYYLNPDVDLASFVDGLKSEKPDNIIIIILPDFNTGA